MKSIRGRGISGERMRMLVKFLLTGNKTKHPGFLILILNFKFRSDSFLYDRLVPFKQKFTLCSQLACAE